ncbi:hypothetical protein D3C77_641120 [compost metagenome]
MAARVVAVGAPVPIEQHCLIDLISDPIKIRAVDTRFINETPIKTAEDRVNSRNDDARAEPGFLVVHSSSWTSRVTADG